MPSSFYCVRNSCTCYAAPGIHRLLITFIYTSRAHHDLRFLQQRNVPSGAATFFPARRRARVDPWTRADIASDYQALTLRRCRFLLARRRPRLEHFARDHRHGSVLMGCLFANVCSVVHGHTSNFCYLRSTFLPGDSRRCRPRLADCIINHFRWVLFWMNNRFCKR